MFSLVATVRIVLGCESVLTCGIFNRLAIWSFGSFSASTGNLCAFSCITMMWWTGSTRQHKLLQVLLCESLFHHGIWKAIICVHSANCIYFLSLCYGHPGFSRESSVYHFIMCMIASLISLLYLYISFILVRFYM